MSVMRFSLRTLLLLPVAFWITLIVIQFFEMGPSGHPRFMQAINNVLQTYKYLLSSFDEQPPTISAEELNRGLATNVWPMAIGNNHDLRNIPRELRFDPWGNSLRVEYDVVLPTGEIQLIGVYSLGKDGVSTTQGNDEDDINSWSEKPGYNYFLKAGREMRLSEIVRSLIFTPITFAFLLAIVAVGKQTLRSPRTLARSSTQH